MSAHNTKPNRLISETSPYLLQHARNPVNWFPWGKEAFETAKAEDKPIFLSIGYSACHWCHVMARECFEDAEVADIMNRNFISVKVDREERPDVDGVYMRACQAMTGGGGWPASIFMSADGKPFFTGTYYPKSIFINLMNTVTQLWDNDRESLLESARSVADAISQPDESASGADCAPTGEAVEIFRKTFDPEHGGFGSAPKFPSAHNLMFLLYKAPDMAEKTLEQMYRGGIFDHIGGGFCRYSTDRLWLVPHFEKMLYDNALLSIAYLMACEKTGKEIYEHAARRIFEYLDNEMSCPDGGYYSSQDADTDGREGAFYIFTPEEVIRALGDGDGIRFCRRYGITHTGNFHGGSIPNLLGSPLRDGDVDALIPRMYEYRKTRPAPRTDIKRLTSWNAMTAAAYAFGARILGDGDYLNAARRIVDFIERDLTDGNTVFTCITGKTRLGTGFLDDYAYYIFALIQISQASPDEKYLIRALELSNYAWTLFGDKDNGGYFFSGKDNETLIARPKESWDGAMPSGNSVMAYNLSRLELLTDDEETARRAKLQREFMNGAAAKYPAGYGFYLYSSLPVKKIICALKSPEDIRPVKIRSDWAFRIASDPDYPEINGKTTYYVCENGACLPPSNEL